ncbi:hypothetical protein CARUB_v10019192mg [Capsella rubella]|uniref:SKP1-like protein n=1 Tax=Capsella rubella TaxID=81985 RepID=R0HPD4_9BRAS|nr:SKP1-like protein 14 isoform X2 [Capsella rubella]EOA25823.1 hypothetical protein CARUB_v10019192mg [Capsella rubella]
MSSDKIVLTSSDGESFEVEESVARKLKIVGTMIENDCPEKSITLQNVTGKILALIIEYCKRHVDDDHVAFEEAKKKLKDWDEEFMKSPDLETFVKLMQASNYLNGLLGLTCQSVEDSIKDKSVEEIRESFGLENEEEEAIPRNTLELLKTQDLRCFLNPNNCFRFFL